MVQRTFTSEQSGTYGTNTGTGSLVVPGKEEEEDEEEEDEEEEEAKEIFNEI